MRQGEYKIESQQPSTYLCGSGRCNHAFHLKPLKSGLYHSQDLKVFSCPEYCGKHKVYQNTWPQAFFDDKVHFPLFMLQVDRENTLNREKEYLESHQNRIKNLEISNEQIFVPHPGKSKTTCFVCRAQYTDYRKHIQTKKHKNKLKSSRMQSSIHQLIELVSKSQQPQFRQQISTTCNEQCSRMLSSKTEQSFLKPAGRLSKKQLKDIKSNLKQVQRLQALSLDDVDLQQMKQLKNTGQLNRVQDYRTLTINPISGLDFRVSEYLI